MLYSLSLYNIYKIKFFNPPGHGSEQMTTKDQSPSRTAASDSIAVPAAESVQQQLNRILTSSEFKATDVQKSFLNFVVETVLAGRSHEIKGYTVATQVFGRGEDFNQATDPIVSIQANKLRRALERYYLVAGQNDPVRIDIPKGTYVPLFRETRHLDDDLPFIERRKPETTRTSTWPTIVIQSFENLTGNGDLEYMGVGIATEIALEITRYQEIRVLRQTTGERQRRAADVGARFVLCGSIKPDVNGLKVIVSLVDGLTEMHIWGDSYRTDLDPAEMIAFEERIAGTVVSKILCEDGIIAKTLSPESKRVPPAELTTHQAILRFYRFSNDFSPETFVGTFEALRQACTQEPECGLAWSMLARLYSLNYSLELFDLETPIEKAATYAERGVKLDPTNQRVRMIMAFILLFKNELSAGLAEVDRALQLNPAALVVLENIGYLMTLLGDWQRGPALINQAIEQNPYYSISVHYALWVDWIRQGEYDRAFEETQHFRRPMLFWDPLMKTAILGLLGRINEGVQAGKDLLSCKPDFPTRGRVLIEHYIKFDEIVAKVIQGLKEVGIDVA
jgi:adenylate cyclase